MARRPTTDPAVADSTDDPEALLWDAVQNAPAQGQSVKELMAVTGMGP
jgi:hypothetical protein